MKKSLLFLGFLVLGVSILSAQTKVITGTITSVVSGEGPIPGVTVQIKGTALGTISDISGKYTITVPRDATTLVFTFTGMKKQEIDIAGRSVVDVTMEYDIQALQEVVVTTGYGIKRTPKSASALNQVVSGDKISETRQSDFNSALAGKVSGIQFLGQSSLKLNTQLNSPYNSTLRLRGSSGFETGVSVIYVVDGTIIRNAADINVDDIDNVNVLSGPAASAILGAQGANGAIIITTKKAKMSGERSIGVELNTGLLVSSVYLLPAFQNDYAGGNTYDMTKYTYKNTDPIEWKTLDGKYYPNYSDDASWGPRMAGQEYIPWYAWYPGTKYTGKTAKLVPQPDNVREFYETGLTSNSNISFNKSGKDYNIRAVIGNIYTKGNIHNSYVSKTTLTLKTNYDVTRNLTVTANLNFLTSFSNGDFYDDYSNASEGIFSQWFHRDLDMDIMRELQNLRSPVGSLASWNHNDPPLYTPDNPILFYGRNYDLNPYSYFDYRTINDRADRLYGDISLDYKIIKGLDFKITYRRQEFTGWTDSKIWSDLDESYAVTPGGTGYFRSSLNYEYRNNFETLLSFSRKFGQISVNANAGSDFFDRSSKTNTGLTVNGLNIRNLFALSNSKDQPSVTNSATAEKYRAIFVRGDIGFRDFLFGEFTLRNDWFSSLPPGNNSILSKSFGVSFVFNDLLKLSWLSFGKLRASWGEIPASIGPYVYPGFAYHVEQYKWNNNFIMTTPDQLVDPKIKGSAKTQKEIGLEARFLKNTFGFTVTYWDATEKDIPYPVTISGYSGFSSKYLNTGKIAKKGMDISLSLRPLSFRSIIWDINATASPLIKNEVVRIADGIDRFVVQSQWGGGTPDMVHAVGLPWGELFGSGMKMYNGKPELYPDGSYVTDPKKYFGSVLPKVTGGIQNTFQLFKKFTVTANFDYCFGGKYFSLSDMWGTFSGLTARTSGLNDKGIPIRDPVADGGGIHVFGVDTTSHHADVDYYIDAQTYFHNLINNTTMDSFVYDLTYIKFRELSISYDFTFDKAPGVKKYLQDLRVSLVAQNFWIIYAKNYDRDPSEVSNPGGEQGQLPGSRLIGLNIRADF
jgi:TonB-linked SusC/RagA family outer membrane protein